MRLLYQNGHWNAHFTLVWEVELLTEMEDTWVSFALPGQTTPIGAIHSQTHIIRLLPDTVLSNRQVVILLPPTPTPAQADSSIP